MFDIITKNVDMKNVAAIPIDMKDLIGFYNNTHPEYEVYYDETEPMFNMRMKKIRKHDRKVQNLIEVYEILEHFIKEKAKLDSSASFIVDELPIVIDGNCYYCFLVRVVSLNYSPTTLQLNLITFQYFLYRVSFHREVD